MTDWRGRDEGPDPVKIGLAVGATAGLIVLAWMYMARTGEERVSSSGFNFGGPAPLKRDGAPPAVSTGPQTGLAFVRFGFSEAPDSTRPMNLPGAAPGTAAPAAPAGPAAAPAAPSAPAGDAAKPEDVADLAKLGVKDDPSSLSRLGAQKGLLSGLVEKAFEHPAALRLLLNNKTLVDAYFSRGLVAKNCSSGSALTSYLSNASDPNGVSEEISLAKSFLSHPDAAAAAAGTEFGRRLTSCPSVREVASSPGAAAQLAAANPALMGLIGDPNAMKALSSNPQALSLLGGAQSSLGGAK